MRTNNSAAPCWEDRKKCYVCGNTDGFVIEPGISLRDASCPTCGARRRNSDLAKVIVQTYTGDSDLSLDEALPLLRGLTIFEAQAQGPIHDRLKDLPHYIASEFFDAIPLGECDPRGIRSEDLQHLTFANNTFDLVITQDVFEHIREPNSAFCEIWRVLKPGGYHIFTVPYHEGKKTLRRVEVRNGEDTHLLPLVYHCDPLRQAGALVYTDFGEDIGAVIDPIGFHTDVIQHDRWYAVEDIPSVENEIAYENYLKYYKSNDLCRFFTYNSVVFKSEKISCERCTEMLEWTGERYLPYIDPEVCGAEIHYEHLHRYALASRFAQGKRVLDLASGEGYGSYLLSQAANHVVGIDIDGTAVDHATKTYQRVNLEFIEGSMLNVPIDNGQLFDIIVCFEALEHVEEHTALLSEVKRLLKDNGLFIVSSPNKKIYSQESEPANPFHKKELYFSEFRKLLHDNFSNVVFLGQRVVCGSRIWDLASESSSHPVQVNICRDKDQFQFTNVIDENPLYYIAIATDGNINEVGDASSTLCDLSDSLIRHKQLLEKLAASTLNNVSVLTNELSAISTENARLQEQYNTVVQELQQKDRAVLDLTNKFSVVSTENARLREQYDVAVQELQQKDRAVSDLTNKLSAVSAENARLQEQYDTSVQMSQKLEQELFAIKRSVSHQLMMKFHRVFVEPIFPQGTVRRINYERGLLALRNIVGAGPGKLRWYISEWRGHRRLQDSSFAHGTIPIIPRSSDTEKPFEMIDKKVTVVIPTKDAGRTFEYTLKRIREQQGIKELDIVIVDSGSKDETLEIAAKFGARVQTIVPENFNHGETRNLGASNADGDYILFTVQDALPIGKYWLYMLVTALEADEQLAAVTCRQIPSSDADLFACFSLWHHYTVTLQFYEDRVFSGGDTFDALPVDEKRRRAGLEDVCCCIKKEIFDQYRFKRIQSSEDLDLGIRLMQGGYKLGYLFSAGVIHSHNRNPDYFLKRSYIDTKTVSKIVGFNSQEVCDGCSMNEIIGSILTLYAALNDLATRADYLSFNASPNILIQKITIYMRDYIANKPPDYSLTDIHGPLGTVFGEILHSIPGISPASDAKQVTLLFDQYIWLLKEFEEFLGIYESLEDKRDDFIISLYKLFAIVAGASISSYYLKRSLSGDLDDLLISVDTMLCEGV